MSSNIIEGSLLAWSQEIGCVDGVASASAVGLPTSGVLPRSVAIRSHRTGVVKVFDLITVDTDDESETAVFHERATNPTQLVRVLIHNC
jgi:hypothetical protein